MKNKNINGGLSIKNADLVHKFKCWIQQAISFRWC